MELASSDAPQLPAFHLTIYACQTRALGILMLLNLDWLVRRHQRQARQRAGDKPYWILAHEEEPRQEDAAYTK
jgi:hypothetical protein